MRYKLKLGDILAFARLYKKPWLVPATLINKERTFVFRKFSLCCEETRKRCVNRGKNAKKVRNYNC